MQLPATDEHRFLHPWPTEDDPSPRGRVCLLLRQLPVDGLIWQALLLVLEPWTKLLPLD